MSYRDILERARIDNFHVTFATVPLDAWGLNHRTIRLFKENAAHLSLLVHGNNHTWCELGLVREPAAELQNLAQAIRRIEQLERTSGLRVDRAMVPPFEAMTDSAIAQMLPVGFEGVTTSPWSLLHWTKSRRWPSTFGLEPADLTDHGFPVLSRYKLAPECIGPSVISAYLGRPIVLIEYHRAVERGIDLLSTAARVVNDLGDVEWCGIEAMLRSNYLQRQADGVLWVRPYSCRIELRGSEGIRAIGLCGPEEPNSLGMATATMARRSAAAEGIVTELKSDTPTEVKPGETIELRSPHLGTVDPYEIAAPAFSVPRVAQASLVGSKASKRISIRQAPASLP